jgi:hypothetical protein
MSKMGMLVDGRRRRGDHVGSIMTLNTAAVMWVRLFSVVNNDGSILTTEGGFLQGDFLDFFSFYVLHSTLLNLLPLRFHCVGGC